MMTATGETLAKSESEVRMANVATLLVSASKLVAEEVIPNFEAVLRQKEIRVAQKQKDLSTVQTLLNSDSPETPTLQKAATLIHEMTAVLDESATANATSDIQVPEKPLPENTRLRDTLRRLHYIQQILKAVAKWINNTDKDSHLEETVLYTKIQQELIRTLKHVVLQIQQAALIIGKYRDMGDIEVLREIMLETQATLNALKKADDRITEKRKSIPFLKRTIQEAKTAPKVVQQLAFVISGLIVVVGLSFAVIKLDNLVPRVMQEFEPAVESTTVVSTAIKPSTLPTESKTESKQDISKQDIQEPNVDNAVNDAAAGSEPTRSQVRQIKASTLLQSTATESISLKKSTPLVPKKTTSRVERTTEKTTEQENTALESREGKETSSAQSEKPSPVRKTIVVED